MVVKHYYREPYQDDILQELLKNNVPHKITSVGEKTICFSLAVGTKSFEAVSPHTTADPLVFVEHTKKELQEAAFLCIHPQKQIINRTNTLEAYISKCETADRIGLTRIKHRTQIAEFEIKKTPIIGKNSAFYAPDDGSHELFVDNRICKIVLDGNLKGIEFWPVRTKRGVSNVVQQMITKNILSSQNIMRGHGEIEAKCPICNQSVLYVDYNNYQLHLDVALEQMQDDFYMTESIFGEGITFPYYLISNRFYQLLSANKLTGGLRLTPVIFKNPPS